MPALRLTSKRQATFPVETCEALRIGPGDTVELEPTLIDGERVWLLRPRRLPKRPWLACLRGKTAVSNHSMEAIRRSIAAGKRRNGK